MKKLLLTLAISSMSLALVGCGGGAEPKPGDLDSIAKNICIPDTIANSFLISPWGCVQKVAGVTYSFVCKDGQGLNVLEGSNKTIQQILAGTRYSGPVAIGGTRFSCMSGKY